MINRLISFYRLQVELLWKWRPGRRALIKRGIVSLVVGTVALLLTVVILPGVKIDNLSTIVFAVVLLALFNALVRPVVLGAFAGVSTIAVILATLILQVLAFFLIEWLLPGFHLTGVIPAFFGPIVFALFNTLFAAILNADSGETVLRARSWPSLRARPARRDRQRQTRPGDRPDRRPGSADPGPPDPCRSRAVHLASGSARAR